MCAYEQPDYALPHWKHVFQCCAKCTSINLPDKETDYQCFNMSASIFLPIYHIIACFTTYVRHLLNDRKICRKCKQDSVSEQPTKIYTRKELVIMETKNYNSHTSFCIPEIPKLI